MLSVLYAIARPSVCHTDGVGQTITVEVEGS